MRYGDCSEKGPQHNDAAYNPLPNNSPFTKRRDYIRNAIEDGVIPCCRVQRPSWLERDVPPLCRVEADEVFRFLYRHAFGRHAVIQIGKRRDEVTVERRWYPGWLDEPEHYSALLTDNNWQKLQSAISAVGFWSLPDEVLPHRVCLDGCSVIVEARRGNEFRATLFRHPEEERFWSLFHLVFDLAGLADVHL
jgi:hypothetical protein